MHGTYVGDGRMLVRCVWGAKLLVSSHDLSLMPDLVAEGTYDVPFTSYVRRTVSAGMTVIDVGANVGLFTVLLAWQTGPTGRVLAYEADEDNVALLTENVALNYLSSWVDVHDHAVGQSVGRAEFFSTSRFRGNSSLIEPGEGYAALSAGLDTTTVRTVDVAPLDSLIGRVARIDLVKIDVEGAEYLVLRGMRGLIAAGTVDRIAVEVSRDRSGSDWPSLVDEIRDLADHGWTCSTIGADGELLPLSVERLVEIGQFSQVLLQRPDEA